MSAKIICMDFEGQPVAFNSDGWINATEAAARFGKEPAQWLRLDSTKEYIERLSARMEKSNVGKSHITLVKARRGNTAASGTWLHPKLAVKFARWLSVDFEIWCDEQVDALIRGELGSRSIARRQAAIGYRSLCDALSITRESTGKAPKPHVFMNEARLINEVITGNFGGRDRDQLNQAELELIMLVEGRDVLLIGQGKDYAARKAELNSYVHQLREKTLAKVA